MDRWWREGFAWWRVARWFRGGELVGGETPWCRVDRNSLVIMLVPTIQVELWSNRKHWTSRQVPLTETISRLQVSSQEGVLVQKLPIFPRRLQNILEC